MENSMVYKHNAVMKWLTLLRRFIHQNKAKYELNYKNSVNK